MTKLSTC